MVSLKNPNSRYPKVIFVVLAILGLLGCTGIASQGTGSPVHWETGDLIEFYGQECPHCANMVPIVSEVENETNVTFMKLEVWHNTTNSGIMGNYASAIYPACGGTMGVPAFYNVKTGKAACGEMSKEKLLAFVNSK